MTGSRKDMEEYLGQLFAGAERRAAVLADVNHLTDAYRLKVLQDETKALKKVMARRKSRVPLCTGRDPDHDDAS